MESTGVTIIIKYFFFAYGWMDFVEIDENSFLVSLKPLVCIWVYLLGIFFKGGYFLTRREQILEGSSESEFATRHDRDILKLEDEVVRNDGAA